MKDVLNVLESFSLGVLDFSEKLTSYTLNLSQFLTESSLHITGNLLHGLASLFFMIESWNEGLSLAASSVLNSKTSTQLAFKEAVENTLKSFEIAKESIPIAKDYAYKFLYENKGISSVIGSSHHNQFGMSSIELSFRLQNQDAAPEEVWKDFKNSQMQKLVLLIPGLFCDETLWENEAENSNLKIVSLLRELGYYPVFIRFNPGLHISSNGKKLSHLLGGFCKYLESEKLNVISYSQGGLIFRSALYYEREFNYKWREKIAKVLFISSPDRGSYLEKIGFWIGFLFEISPNLALKIIGMLGNLRSDGIKDLSHGIIREEDWKTSKQVRRYATKSYYGELDDIDAYQIYSLFSNKEDWFSVLLGDGIIEKPSLEYLKKDVFLKKENPKLRSILVDSHNHFSILDSAELKEWLRNVLL